MALALNQTIYKQNKRFSGISEFLFFRQLFLFVLTIQHIKITRALNQLNPFSPKIAHLFAILIDLEPRCTPGPPQSLLNVACCYFFCLLMNNVYFCQYFFVASVQLATGFCQLHTCRPDILVKFKVFLSALLSSDQKSLIRLIVERCNFTVKILFGHRFYNKILFSVPHHIFKKFIHVVIQHFFLFPSSKPMIFVKFQKISHFFLNLALLNFLWFDLCLNLVDGNVVNEGELFHHLFVHLLDGPLLLGKGKLDATQLQLFLSETGLKFVDFFLQKLIFFNYFFCFLLLFLTIVFLVNAGFQLLSFGTVLALPLLRRFILVFQLILIQPSFKEQVMRRFI